MEIWIQNLIRKWLPSERAMVGVGLAAILALASVVAVGSAQAIEKGAHKNVIQLAATDTHAADEASKDTEASGGKNVTSKKAAKADLPDKKTYGPIGSIFAYLGSNIFVFLFLSLAIGYPLGAITVKGINLGATAGTLIVGIALSLTAFIAFDIKYEAPDLLSTVFLLLFMYAIGMKVGPQFFSGIARGGMDFVVIGLIVAFSNFLICFFGAKLASLDPGYGAGIISGSYTITAVIGVATGAVTNGAVHLPEGVTANDVGANLAAGYAVAYILSSIFTILVIKYLPVICGVDPVKAGKEAEAAFGAGVGDEALPGSVGTSAIGISPMEIRAYKVEHEELAGQSVLDLFHKYPKAAILKVVRGDQVMVAADNPTLEVNDILGIQGFYSDLIAKGAETVGSEIDEPRARDVEIEVADIVVGRTEHAGQTLEQVKREIGFGVYLKSMFRQGAPFPHHPNTILETGDVVRLGGPKWCVDMAAKKLGGSPLVESSITETKYLSVALVIGYLVGHFSVKIAGIPFALGTSAGCMLAGILFSWWRTRNPAFGGPMSEGARSFIQDIGLNVFIAVLAANVGPKILDSFQGTVVIWIALIGILGALVPPILGWIYGFYFRKMNPAILQGAIAGARNHTASLKAAQEICESDMPAVGYPVPYAITSALVLILGYLAMVLN
jgi:putative transport protein